MIAARTRGGVVLRSVQPASVCAAQPQTAGTAHHHETQFTRLAPTIAGTGVQHQQVVRRRRGDRGGRRSTGGSKRGGAHSVRGDCWRRCLCGCRGRSEIQQRFAHDLLQRTNIGHCRALAVTAPQHQPGQTIGVAAGKRIDHGTLQCIGVCRAQHRGRRCGAFGCRGRRARKWRGMQGRARLIGKHRIAVSAKAAMDRRLRDSRSCRQAGEQKQQCQDPVHSRSIRVSAARPTITSTANNDRPDPVRP